MTAKARKPRKAKTKALQATPDPVRREPQARVIERALDDISDDARRLKALLTVIERIACILPLDTYLSDWNVCDFIGLTTVARERAEALVERAENVPRP
jgi:hypothetical protein